MSGNLYKIILFIFLIILSPISSKNLDFLSEETLNFSLDLNEKINEKSFSYDLAKYFIFFASYGYCTLEEIELKACCSDHIQKEGWELVFSDKIEISEINFSVLKHDTYNKIIFTFTGTRGKFQFIEEILNQKGVIFKDKKTEKLMDYFNSAYLLLEPKIKSILIKLTQQYPKYQYIFTGHSLGGSLASIAILEALRSKILTKEDNYPVLITYGQPRTGNDVLANELMKEVPTIFRVVKQGDLVAVSPICAPSIFSLSSNCPTILKDSEFDKDLKITTEQEEIEFSNFYAWHLGGLKLFTDSFDSFRDCGNQYGDNHPDEACKIKMSFSLQGHINYFGIWVSRYCRYSK
jgi:hypothetical protein